MFPDQEVYLYFEGNGSFLQSWNQTKAETDRFGLMWQNSLKFCQISCRWSNCSSMFGLKLMIYCFITRTSNVFGTFSKTYFYKFITQMEKNKSAASGSVLGFSWIFIIKSPSGRVGGDELFRWTSLGGFLLKTNDFYLFVLIWAQNILLTETSCFLCFDFLWKLK